MDTTDILFGTFIAFCFIFLLVLIDLNNLMDKLRVQRSRLKEMEEKLEIHEDRFGEIAKEQEQLGQVQVKMLKEQSKQPKTKKKEASL